MNVVSPSRLMFAQKFILSVIRNILQLISFPSFASSRPVVARRRRRLFNLLISFLQLLLQLTTITFIAIAWFHYRRSRNQTWLEAKNSFLKSLKFFHKLRQRASIVINPKIKSHEIAKSKRNLKNSLQTSHYWWWGNIERFRCMRRWRTCAHQKCSLARISHHHIVFPSLAPHRKRRQQLVNCVECVSFELKSHYILANSDILLLHQKEAWIAVK